MKELTEPIDGSNLQMNEICYFHMPSLQYRTLNNMVDSNDSEKHYELARSYNSIKICNPEITINVHLFCMQ